MIKKDLPYSDFAPKIVIECCASQNRSAWGCHRDIQSFPTSSIRFYNPTPSSIQLTTSITLWLLESCKQGCGLESENAQVSEKTNGTWLQLVRSCALSTVL